MKTFTSPILCEEVTKHIPDTAVVIDLGPGDILQALLGKSLAPKGVHVSLVKTKHENNVEVLFESLGK